MLEPTNKYLDELRFFFDLLLFRLSLSTPPSFIFSSFGKTLPSHLNVSHPYVSLPFGSLLTHSPPSFCFLFDVHSDDWATPQANARMREIASYIADLDGPCIDICIGDDPFDEPTSRKSDFTMSVVATTLANLDGLYYSIVSDILKTSPDGSAAARPAQQPTQEQVGDEDFGSSGKLACANCETREGKRKICSGCECVSYCR